MVAYLSKSGASERFNQIIDFWNGSSIKYALTVNPNIYVSCIKQFWTTIAVKQANDVIGLQALVDRKKVVVTEATIREALRLDDAEGVDCLPNEEIFAELARMVYEKPSTKLTFYKAFFSSQWNLVRNVDSHDKFYMYPCFLQLIIGKQVGDLSTHTTKYTSPALTQKEIDEEGDADEHVKEVNTSDAVEGYDSAAHGKVPTVAAEQSIPPPIPPTPPPQPPQDIPSTSQVQQTPPQLPQVQPPSPQPQLLQAIDFPMSLLQEAMDACAALTRRVEHMEYDKVAQALEITKLKRRVKKLEKRNQGKMIAKMDQDDALEDDKVEDKDVADAVKDVEKAKVAEIDVVTTAKLITEVVIAASETVTATSAIITTAEAQVHADITATLTVAPVRVAAAPSKRRKGVVIMDPEEESTTSTIIPAKTKSKDKGKAKEDPAVKKYQAMKRKPHIEAQARKNMMIYLKNVSGFKLDYFKGMSYDDIHLIFEAKFNSNVDFLLKTKEHIEDDENITLQTINETPVERAAKRRKLNEEVEDLKRHLQIVPNKDDDVYTEATLFARKELEALWSLVKERFSIAKPKNFSDDFLLTTLGATFEKLDAHLKSGRIKELYMVKQRSRAGRYWNHVEKCHFMVKEGIVLGHKVSGAGLEVDKAKIDVILKLPPNTNIK
nr:retrovirus-related Pol polyprotein from transposon opus [Tanacetum cinerariifolium]